MGIERVDDAGVYQIAEDLALIHTIDFFTPIVDDPFSFGQIAAANALSDVYAMGGKPLTAMNVVCFPSRQMDISVLREILRGGLDKMKEAGCVLVGGHSVEDSELKYGLAVVGVIHPQKVVKNQGARPNDRIVLTKPIGTGVLATAIKAGLAGDRVIKEVIAHMSFLNKAACEAMVQVGVNAATDITGFGLLGHASEMVDGTDVGMEIFSGSVPFLSQAEEFVELGLVPAGTYRNKDFRRSMVDVEEGVPESILDLLFDPQTSGGLLISVPEGKAPILLEELRRRGVPWARIIGRVTATHPGVIRVLK